MAAGKTLLDELRAQSQVDCDTLDYEVAEALGPFVDCTSNQAIAYGELQKPRNAPLVAESIQLAKELHPQFVKDVTLEQLATEIMMVKLSSRMTPYLTGFAHIQTNPYTAYSIPKTISNAQRIIHIYALILPTFPSSRICIKIPSTHEGLQACAQLESQGVHTLATTLFSPLQYIQAAKAKCTYIAPYINELGVHFTAYVDEDKGFAVARGAQRYFRRTGKGTKVLPASLVSVEEVMRLKGVDHVTVSPALLYELARTPATGVETRSWFNEPAENTEEEEEAEREGLPERVCEDENAYRMAFTRSKRGQDERKLVDAINIFADMQDKMEEMVRGFLK